jgi:hypothetical protein
MKLNIKTMQFPFKATLLLYLISCIVVSAESDEFKKTIGMLNSQFKGYVISRKATKDITVTMLEYRNELFDLESYSKQSMLGVRFLIKNDGQIISISPIEFKSQLPSQESVNSEVNRSVRASDFFSRNSLTQKDDVQAYGLLSRWAIATLARQKGVVPNLDLLDEQKVVISKLFNGSVVAPQISVDDKTLNSERIENFAREIIQYVNK